MTSQTAPKRPWWKALWFVGLIALIVGAGIGAASASGSGGTPKAAPAPTVTATATTTATATATVEATVTAHPVVKKVIATKTRTITVTYTPKPKRAVSDGTYKVGRDMKPGEYRTTDHRECYWERDSNLSGSLGSIIANDNIDGPTSIEVNNGEYVKFAGGCEWRRP